MYQQKVLHCLSNYLINHLYRLKAQRQIRDILQGVSSLGVQFTRKILASYDKQFSSQDKYFVKKGRIPLLSLNELGEKSRATIILGKFVKKPKSNCHWLIVSGKCFSLVRILKHVHMAYSFLELLIFFCLTLEVICVYFSPHQRNNVREYKLHGKPIMKYLP